MPPAAPPPPVPHGKYGRPPKFIVPTDGTPLTPEMQRVLRERERKRRAYQANPEHYCAQVRRNFNARQEKMHDALRQFEELKRTLANLAIAAAAGEPVTLAIIV